MIENIYAHTVWDNVYFTNTLGAYVDAVIIFVLILLVFYLLSKILARHVVVLTEGTKTDLDDIIVSIITSIHPPAYLFIALYMALQTLTLSTLVGQIAFALLIVSIVWQVMRVVQLLIDFIAQKEISTHEDSQQITVTIGIFSGIVKFALWIIAILLILSNIGIDVTSLIAGIGIGGIAIAFALRSILEDLFSSFSIYFDKPFMVGDTIDVDGEKGIVQKIGIKTTRLKSLTTGEEIVFANSNLTKKKINNFRRMTKRRVSFTLGVTYETSTEAMKKIPQIIEKIVSTEEHVEFSRTHLRSFEDSAITFTSLYYVDSRTYNTYLDAHQNILFAIREAFDKEQIEFAYPTQTIHVDQA